ncbi:hypothetical protein STEG23_037656, partial [Scotinomys teguina]
MVIRLLTPQAHSYIVRGGPIGAKSGPKQQNQSRRRNFRNDRGRELWFQYQIQQ